MVQPIALTCGEPSGVGPELAVMARAALGASLPFFWIGDPAHLPKDTSVTLIRDPADALSVRPSHLPVWVHRFAGPNTFGQPNPENAQSVIDVITRAVALVQTGQARAICTAPIAKKALQDGAGFAFPGHTEFLAHLGQVDHVVMMLACETLRVVPATIHIALKDVQSMLTAHSLERTIRITHDALIRDFAVQTPRIAVAGLNPHAGEGGNMGREELEMIAPLVAKLRSQGMQIFGPLPADTMFHSRARQTYDVAICMYHDQALIPIKTIDFDGGVNVTLGLPFIRTSPDHGTAFDIAGKGIARADSLIAALRLADKMSVHHAA
jgi:4-hydroxythreonine-4-phosphate dehydrogenase